MRIPYNEPDKNDPPKPAPAPPDYGEKNRMLELLDDAGFGPGWESVPREIARLKLVAIAGRCTDSDTGHAIPGFFKLDRINVSPSNPGKILTYLEECWNRYETSTLYLKIADIRTIEILDPPDDVALITMTLPPGEDGDDFNYSGEFYVTVESLNRASAIERDRVDGPALAKIMGGANNLES